jgi:filamentous hemagglutinin family protein
MKNDSLMRQLHLKRKFIPLLVAACFSGAGAAPVLPQVVSGQASFVQQGNVFSITNTPNAIINWQSFSVNPGEITRFVQQNANSAVLNRIVGQDPSQILGALQSNGHVFLINPNGILFGRDARVDVNGLTASTLNLSNADFLAGKKNFTAGASAGSVVNQGAITTPGGGQVFLIAPGVENKGIISSPQGQVVLAAGHSVQLVDSANPDLHVVVSAPASQAINLGQVIAQGGRIGIYGALVNQRGTVSANSAVLGENGKIVLKARGDTLLEAGSVTSATGAGKGGEIQILGDRVALTGNATVDASGNAGGGTVLVGGDYQGQNPLVRNAGQVFVDRDAAIGADAQQAGDGGKVIVWSDGITRAYGTISARGGAAGGNGGFVETSGKYLDMQARVDTRAPLGKTGTLLLDPTDIYIAASQANATAAGMTGADASANSSGPLTFLASGVVGNSLLSVAALQAALSTSSVTVSTVNPTGAAAGDIIVVDPITWPSTSQLVLSAEGGIKINASITAASGVLSLRAYGNGGIAQVQPIKVASLLAYADVGAVTLNNAANSVATLAGYTGSAFSFTNSGALTIGTVSGSNGIRTNNAAPVTLMASSGNLDIANALYGVESAGGNVTLSAPSGKVTESAGFVKAASLAVTAGQGIDMLSASNLVDTLNYTQTGTGAGLTVGFQNNAALNLASSSNASSGGATTVATTASKNLEVSGAVSSAGGPMVLTGPAGVHLSGSGSIATGGGSLVLQTASANAGFVMDSGTAIETGGGQLSIMADNMSLGGTATAGAIGSGSGAVTLMPYTAGTALALGAGATDGAGSLGLTDAELATIHTTSASTGTLIVSSGSGTLEVVGALDLAAPGRLAGGLSLVANSGNITVKPGSALTVPNHLFMYADGTLETNAAVSAGSMLLEASRMKLNSGAITANSVGLSNPSGAIDLGSVSDLGAGLELSNAELNLFLTPSLSIMTNGHNISVTAQSVLAAGVGTLSLNSTENIAVETGAGIKVTNDLFLTAGSADKTIINGGALEGVNVGLTAPKMTLAGGSLIGSGSVQLYSGATADVWLGTAATDSTPGTLELSSAELNTVFSPLLRIGSNGSGDISVQGALTNGAGGAFEHLTSISTLGLHTATGNITQDTGATLGGVNQISLNGGSVHMMEANPTGVVSGVSASDFAFRSSNQVSLGYVDGVHGITGAVGVSNVVLLTSDNFGINQSIGNPVSIPGGWLALSAKGPAMLTESGNDFRYLAAALNFGASGRAPSAIYSNGDLDVGNEIFFDAPYNGVDNNDQHLHLKVGAGALTLNGQIVTTGAATVILTAGAASSPTTSNVVNFEVTPTAPGGLIVNANRVAGTLAPVAGPGVTLNVVGSTTTTPTPTPTPTQPPAPTLTDCIANPNLSGCSAILPTLVSCISAPTTAGCSAVLPDLQICLTAPATAGCSIVLPALEACLSDPTTSGCSVVLPLLAACISAPATPGCSVVLPGIATCTADPSVAGCSVVLPSLTLCASAPTTAGCSAVLPSLTSCIAAPASAGCSVVLPSLPTCIATPTAQGCSVVLPTLASCITSPATAGCSVVLPTLATCIASPASAGCSIVLPTMTACIAAPATAGCTAVLPTLSQCVTAPTAAGCTVVLPSLAACIAAPAAQGCSVVLPTLSQCTATPTQAGCAVVLPGLSQCTADPALAGCAVVLPTLSACVASPALAGCSAVLPTLTQCTATPALTGCAVVLPTLAQCAASPALQGCSAVVPAAADCSVTPSLPACVVVSPAPPAAPVENPVAEAISATVSIINTVTTTSSSGASLAPVSAAATASTAASAGSGSDTQNKDEAKKEEKVAATPVKAIGAKNEPAKPKTYCN